MLCSKFKVFFCVHESLSHLSLSFFQEHLLKSLSIFFNESFVSN